MRKEFPNHRIIFAGYKDDYLYFRDNNGDWTIDEYISFDWWPIDRGCHEIKGPLTDEAIAAFAQLKERSEVYMDTTAITLKEYSDEFKAKSILAYPFKNIVSKDRKIDNHPHIIIYARAKNYAGLDFRSWEPEKWHQFMDELLCVLPNNYKVYVCGVEAESVHFQRSDRIVPILKGLDRSKITLNLLSNAKYCISDCSGSGNFAIQCGIPTFISGPNGYKDGFEKTKNYFGVYVKYQTCDMRTLSSELRMKGFLDFYSGLYCNLEREVYNGVD